MLRLAGTRWELQTLGAGARQLLGDDVWIRAWKRQLPDKWQNVSGPLVIVDDARYPNEFAAMKDGIHVLLTANRETQWARYQTSTKFDPTLTREEWEAGHAHETETYWRERPLNEWDAIIHTDDITPDVVATLIEEMTAYAALRLPL